MYTRSSTARLYVRQCSGDHVDSEEVDTDRPETRTITLRNLDNDHASVSAACRAFASCSFSGGEKAGLSSGLLMIDCLRRLARARSRPNEVYTVPLAEKQSD
jgi:hypothetical protein